MVQAKTTAINSMFMRIYATLITAALISIFTWVWNTSAQVNELTGDVNDNVEAIRAIPKMQTDIALIKQSQQATEDDISEIKDAIKELSQRRTYTPTR